MNHNETIVKSQGNLAINISIVMKKKNSEIYPVGTKVYKISGNPFKSGIKIATITGVVINEQDPKKRQAYTFTEDDSIVNCELCKDANEHIPTTLMDTQVGDTLHVIEDVRKPASYVKKTQLNK